MMKLISTILFSATVIVSCNPVGKTVTEETPVDGQLVNTVENLDLKAGDELVIWGKMDASFLKNDDVPIFDLRYNLSLDGKTIENQTVPMFAGNDKIIKSTYEIRKEEEQEDDQYTDERTIDSEAPTEKNVEPTKSDWSFEQEVIKIPITKDGKYTLDYKANSNDEDADSMFTKVAVIIRKR
ncbi:hypothetical protein NG800_008840 [Epilithonimonas ginsengisoli]|uniref:DUF4625 domain-containing protein n=1 Tax=Epilithonimonas ginsengisoli TaxID=1245592 RepID=A0ABU4JHB6_9FLAO|nr:MULTISPECIES: hypothetical protein [Chryseobacterium group]MBV6880349.1 hypothetical protein [Epilithonimonas sp. FP105]MDW8549017.1 hypothetical protein [Epilithonimonas ginsengisoli]OAH74754.1 hypothetical protein AXA65_05875 [Chryseobacterium sp. FP211-J200]